MQILVVEDDFISRRLICRYLEPFGDCDVAIDGSEAVEAVRTTLDADNHYDLICLDIMMPGISGQEALALIRELEQEYGVPAGQGAKVVMTSALEDRDSINQAFDLSADGYAVKPIAKPKFIATLQKLGFEVPQTTE